MIAPQTELSVVITTWNRADRVGHAVRSAVDATEGLHREVVIVDDGSSDATPEVLGRLAGEVVKVVRQSNGGLAAARNRGVAEATGRWLAFLDDDDEMLPGWAAALTPAWADPSVGIVSGAAELVDGNGVRFGTAPPEPLGTLFAGAVAQFFAGCFVVRRDLFDAAGGYLPGLPCSHQTELCIRLSVCAAESGLGVVAVPEAVARIERRRPKDRPLQNARLLRDGSRWVLARHADRFAVDPRERHSWESVVAVAAARTRRWDLARRYSARALRSRPTNAAAWGRAAAMRVPLLAARIWRPGPNEGAGSEADRRPLVNAASVLRRAAPAERFFLPWRYRENPPASADSAGTPFWEGGIEENDVRYQDAVYRWAARLAASARPVVLDVGCGSGHKLVRHVAPCAGTTIGVDQASGIAVAERAFPDRRWMARDLADGAAWDELIALAPDLVLCSDVIEHVEEPIELLHRLGRVAGREGVILLSTPDRTRLERAGSNGPPVNPRHIREWSAEELELLAEAAGLEVLERRHFLPRRYSFTRTDVNRTLYRAMRRRPLPDRRSSFALLLRVNDV